MIEVYKNLYIGNQQDYEINVSKKQSGWCIIHAYKEPYHRALLCYTGRGAPKNHPEYLIAKRNNRLFLHLVNANSPNFIPKEIFDSALTFIKESLSLEKKLFVAL